MKSLKYKVLFTALSRIINTIFAFVIQLILTPLVLGGLGQYLFGIYSLLNKVQGYMSFIDLRPSAILRYKLAVLQGTESMTEKRKFVGASIYISFISMPLIIICGIVLANFFPIIFKISNQYLDLSRNAVFLLAVILSLKSFLGIPEAILRGNNLEYKGMYIEPLRNVILVCLIWLSFLLNYGLIGLIISSFISFVVAFFLKLIIQKRELPGYLPLKPEKKQVVEFTKKGSWYLLSSFSFQLLQTLDVILIGIFFSPITITLFAVTKSLVFRVSEAFVTITGSVSASIGDLIGKKDISRLKELRLQLMRLNLIVGLVLFLYFSLFNKSFISLWVGVENFAGVYTNLAISFTIPFIILSMTTQMIIDSFLKFKEKSFSIFAVSILTILMSIVFIKLWGLFGVAFAILLGRILLWILYEILLNKHIQMNFFSIVFLKQNYRILLLYIAVVMCVITQNSLEISSWVEFIGCSFVYMFIMILLTYLLIASKEEKKIIQLTLRSINGKSN